MTHTHEHLISFARDAWDISPEYPWEADGAHVLRHPVTRKWIAIFMSVSRKKLGLPGDGMIEVMNIKCSADTLGTLLGSDGFHPAYHMNKSHWMTVLLDGCVPCDMLEELVMMSYELVS